MHASLSESRLRRLPQMSRPWCAHRDGRPGTRMKLVEADQAAGTSHLTAKPGITLRLSSSRARRCTASIASAIRMSPSRSRSPGLRRRASGPLAPVAIEQGVAASARRRGSDGSRALKVAISLCARGGSLLSRCGRPRSPHTSPSSAAWRKRADMIAGIRSIIELASSAACTAAKWREIGAKSVDPRAVALAGLMHDRRTPKFRGYTCRSMPHGEAGTGPR